MEGIEKPKRRVRKKRLDLRLEQALRDSEDASKPEADPSLRALVNTRLQVLSARLSREENGKLARSVARIKELEQEIIRLKALLSQPISSEAERLRRIIEVSGGNNVEI